MTRDESYDTEFVCALSGVAATEDEVEAGAGAPTGDDDDDFDGLPLGWYRITVERRMPSPQWELVQQVKRGIIERLLLQVPKEHRDQERVSVTIQIEAQFAALENRMEPVVVEADRVYVAPPERDKALRVEWDKVRDVLGLAGRTEPEPKHEAAPEPTPEQPESEAGEDAPAP